MTPHRVPGSSDQEFFELLEKARLGDQDALGTLIDRYRPYLMKLAYHEGDSHLQAKEGDSDIVQNTCVKALQTFEQFQGKTSNAMRGWLRRILIMQLRDARDRYRTDKRNVQAEVSIQGMNSSDSGNAKLADVQLPPREMLIKEEERVILETAMQQLPELDRMIIELRQKEGRAFPDIARMLNVTEKTAQKRWARAVRSLQEKVNRLHEHHAE